MRYTILVLILFPVINSFSQTKAFISKTFPVEKYEVTYDTTSMTDFKVVLIVARPIVEAVAQYEGTEVWMQRLTNGKLTEKYLGQLETERGIYRPYDQPLKDTYIIVECGEYEGQIDLVTKDGDIVIIPGYYYALNKPGYIYTKTSLNSLVYQYDLKNKKGTDLRGKDVVIDNLLFDEVDGAYWVK